MHEQQRRTARPVSAGEDGGAGDEDFVIDTHGEPDERGEGALTRTAPDGGIELRVNSDHDDAPLAEQMARVLDHPKGAGGDGPFRNAPTPPPA